MRRNWDDWRVRMQRPPEPLEHQGQAEGETLYLTDIREPFIRLGPGFYATWGKNPRTRWGKVFYIATSSEDRYR